MDGETETCRVLFQNKINLRYCASAWFYYRSILRCTVLQTANRNESSKRCLVRNLCNRNVCCLSSFECYERFESGHKYTGKLQALYLGLKLEITS